jgi:hypothetical protein
LFIDVLPLRRIWIVAVRPFSSELIVLALDYHLRVKASLAGVVRRIDGVFDRVPLCTVGAVMLALMLDLPLALMKDDVVLRSCHWSFP